jgi:hypothetical protein
VFEQDFPAHHVGHAVEFARRHRGHVGAVDPVAPFQFGIAPKAELPVGMGILPGPDAIVGAAGFVADPDEMEAFRNHRGGSRWTRIVLSGAKATE